MLQKNNKYKVLKVFLDSPVYEFGLREISRKVGLGLPSVKKYLLDLEGGGFVVVKQGKMGPLYLANRDFEKFKFYMGLFMQSELVESGVIDYVWKKICPEAIVFYGSFLKGDAIESSDVDLFAVGKRVDVDLRKYEKILGKEIHLMNDEICNVPKELKNNLINGVVMKGYFSL